jgi:integrase
MPKQATGHVLEHANGYSARVRIGDGRPSFPLAVPNKEAAEARAKLLVDIAKRLRAIPTEEVSQLIELVANARTEKKLRAALDAVDLIASGGTTTAKAALAPTFEEFAKEWTDGELHRKYPDHVKKKKTSDRDAELLSLYVLPHVGHVRLPDFSLEDAERVMAALPRVHPKTERPLKAGTRRYIAQTLARVLVLACYPGKHMARSPIPRGWLPKVNKTLAKECLYPDEDRLLMAGKSLEEGKIGPLADVPMLRRLVYGFLAREGMRTDELSRLRWRDLDLVRNRVKLDENKTDDPRDWDMQPGTLVAMQLWKANF